jgi:ubiquinone/menaquinone biosynthesis C-methylase UbiE
MCVPEGRKQMKNEGGASKSQEPDDVKRWLANSDTHQTWMNAFYGDSKNQDFYEAAFDRILDIVRPPEGAIFLDAGCGVCAHSIRLANRGFLVHAVDFSEAALDMGRASVKALGLEEKIRISSGNITELPFADESYDYVLCWGVLMHIPDLVKALTELARVLRLGGTLVVSEGNMSSSDSILGRTLFRPLRRRKTVMKKTPAGIEYRTSTGSATRFVRFANVNWLIRRFETEGVYIQERFSGQFTGAYTMVSFGLLKDLIHHFNMSYFNHNGDPRVASGNILIFQKH